MKSPIKVAIISNSVTPYRVHLHQRIARECPDLQVWSFFTHDKSNAPWSLTVPDEIHPLFFGAGEDSAAQSLKTKPWHEIRKARRIEARLSAASIDAVVLFGYNDWCRLHLLLWLRMHGVPCFMFGDSNPQCEASGGPKMLLKRVTLPPVLALCHGAMYCGTKGAEYFRSYGVSPDRLFPFPYEPDYGKVAKISGSEREEAMRDLNFDSFRRRILYSGRLVTIKRVDLLIAAFESLADERENWDLVLAGDGPERVSLNALISPALKQRVRFLGFINEPERLAAIYSACDILVLPSDCEPWGVVVTEAATRLALICSSQVGAAHDLIENHRNGIMFPAGDATALTDALREVTDQTNIDKMKAASPAVLAGWRSQTDPIRGIRRALSSAGFPISIQ